jgi:hypothetical protein
MFSYADSDVGVSELKFRLLDECHRQKLAQIRVQGRNNGDGNNGSNNNNNNNAAVLRY